MGKKQLKYSIKEYQRSLRKAIERYQSLKDRLEQQFLKHHPLGTFEFTEQRDLDTLIELEQVLRNLHNVGTIDGQLPATQAPLFT